MEQDHPGGQHPDAVGLVRPWPVARMERSVIRGNQYRIFCLYDCCSSAEILLKCGPA
jgi:hypothetical protein